MEVIDFPGTSEIVEKKGIRPKYEKPKHLNDMIRGEMQFTCPHCQTKNTFDTGNMIFKLLEFFCGCCGAAHKLRNPSFVEKSK